MPFPKPRPLFEQRAEERAARRRTERSVKTRAKARDGRRCRVPGCGAFTYLEGCHVQGKSAGGDHGKRSSLTSNILTCCRDHHRGSTTSLHSGDLVASPLTPHGADGPVEFFIRTREHGRLISLGISEPKGAKQ